MARVATLWPAGMRSTVVTPSATTMPGGRLERAISTPSSGCRRMTGAGAMGCLLEFFAPLPVLYGERSDCEAVRVRGEAQCQTLTQNSRKEPLTPTLSPQVRGEGADTSRFAA